MTLVTLVTRNRRKRAGRFLVSNLHRHSLPRFYFTYLVTWYRIARNPSNPKHG